MRCTKPANGMREDSIEHAQLVSTDHLTTMRTRCSSFEAYIEVACLDKLEGTINPNTHYHDDLVARPANELKEFRAIMEMLTSEEPQIENRRTKEHLDVPSLELPGSINVSQNIKVLSLYLLKLVLSGLGILSYGDQLVTMTIRSRPPRISML